MSVRVQSTAGSTRLALHAAGLLVLPWLLAGTLAARLEEDGAIREKGPLEHVAGLRGACEALEGRSRLVARLQLCEALEDALEAAPAAFGPETRVGLSAERCKLLASLGCDREAFAAWEQHLLGSNDTARLRREALYEAAQAARRCGEHGRAADLYARFLEQPDSEPAGVASGPQPCVQREQARLWLARSLQETGRHEEASRRWAALATETDCWEVGVAAFDRLALDAVERKDLEGAAGWLHAARMRWKDPASVLTPDGERIRRALVRMSAVDELQLAIATRELRRAVPSFTELHQKR